MTAARAEALVGPVGRDVDARRAEALEAARAHLSAGADADALYSRWFHGATLPVPVEYPSPAAYAAACPDPVRFEAGWTVVAADVGSPGALVVQRTDVGPVVGDSDPADDVRQVWPPWYVPDAGAALAPGPGDRVRVDPTTTAASGGFWHAWSAGWRRGGAPARLTRLYLSVSPRAETTVARAVLAAGPPDERWYVKCATGVHGHPRRDVAVLYLPADQRIPGWVDDVLRDTATYRGGEAPPLTVPTGPGAGLAPDPGDGTSFGQAVCTRLAALASSTPAALEDGDRWRAAAADAVAPLLDEGDRP